MNTSSKKAYQPVIGLEIHAQLSTESKIYSPEANSYGDPPNTNISVVTLAHPGVMPRLNHKVVEYAIRMGLAVGSEISRHQIFDRKNYFYPDLPKGYQLTQDKTPICVGGGIDIEVEGALPRKVQLTKIHIEEDAGKSMHVAGEAYTQVDYNRSGVPLIEIVTEPDIYSAEEAGAVLTQVRQMVRFLEICDGNMEEGSLRCDANVSVRPVGSDKLGRKVEIKNMNSIRNVMRAIQVEVARQIDLLEAGEEVVSETRNFHAEDGTSSSMRTKEELNDYRYFPDPDLSPLEVSEDWIAQIKSAMPRLASEWQAQLEGTYQLPAYDAAVLTESPGLAQYFIDTAGFTKQYKAVSNWMMGPVKSWLNEHNKEIAEWPVSPERLAALIELVAADKLSFSVASQQLLPLLLDSPEADPLQLATQHQLIQESDSGALQPIIEEVLASHPDKVAEYKSGRKGLLGLFVGEVMKMSKGKADPKKTNQLIREHLEKA